MKSRLLLAGAVSEIPRDLRYAESHEWVRVEGDEAVIGITDHAQDALNDIVFVELPQEGDVLAQGEEFGVVESVKSVSELYMPVGGTILEANVSLTDAPEKVNEDPYGEGWLLRVKIEDESQLESLLEPDGYRSTLD